MRSPWSRKEVGSYNSGKSNDVLKAELLSLAADLAKLNGAELEIVDPALLEKAEAAKVPLFWQIGSKLVDVDAGLGEKRALAKGKENFRRALAIFSHFPTLEKARACGRSLRDVLMAAWESIKARGLSSLRLPIAIYHAAAGQVRSICDAVSRVSRQRLPRSNAGKRSNAGNKLRMNRYLHIESLERRQLLTVSVAPTLMSSSSHAVGGQTVIVTASVPSTATGTVTFNNNGSAVESDVSLTNTGSPALYLNGDYGGVSTTLDMTTGSDPDMTISEWVRIDSWGDGTGIVSCFDTSSGGFQRGFGYADNGDWYMQIGTRAWDTGIQAELVNPAAADAGWHHVTAVFTPDNVQFYYDNLSVVSLGESVSYSGSSGHLTIGYDNNSGGSQYSTSAIEEVDVWDVALNSADAAKLYNGGTVFSSDTTSNYPESGSLVAGWHLTESSYSDGEFTDFVSGDAYPGTPFGDADSSWTTATPDPKIATYTFTTDGGTPAVNDFTATYNASEDDTYSGGTSNVLPVLVTGTALPSYTVGENTYDAVDDIPNQATPSPLTDGSNVLSVNAANLIYVSGTNGQPNVNADLEINPSGLSGVTAKLYLGDDVVGETYYSATDLTGASSDGTYRFAVKYTGTALTTGQYSFTIKVFETGSSDQLASSDPIDQNVLNWNSSPFGQGWNLVGLDQLFIDDDDNALLVKSDGTMAYLASADEGSYTSPASGPFSFMGLGYADGVYTLTGTNGVKELFNSSGRLTDVIDHDGNDTSYAWSGSGLDSVLDSMTAPSGHTTAFTYTGTVITSITDFDERVTGLSYSSGQLTTITLPDPGDGETQPVYAFAYASDTGPLTTYVNADGNPTFYSYRSDGTLQTVTNANGSTMTYQAAQALLFPSGDGGTPGSSENPSYLVPSTTVQGVATDEIGDPTLYTFDTFGDQTSVEDSAGNVTVSVYADGEDGELSGREIIAGDSAISEQLW